jgi:hypothetical protein
LLKTSGEKFSFEYEYVGTYASQHCGWSSFNNFTDWAVDPFGNLYVLNGKSKEVWQFILSEKRWTRLLLADKLYWPRSLCASEQTVSILDGGAQPSIARFRVSDGVLSQHIPVAADVPDLKRIFCNDDIHLFLVTGTTIYRWP